MMLRVPWLVLALGLLSFWACGQSPAEDSLRQQLRQARSDTARARQYFQLSEVTESTDSIIHYARQCLRLLGQGRRPTPPSLERLHAAALNNLGVGYELKGDNQQAIGAYQQSLRVRQRLRDRLGLAESYYNLAALFDKLGDVRRALDTYQQSLRATALLPAGPRRLSLEGINLSRLADLYRGQGDTAAARRYSLRALHLVEQSGDQIKLVESLRDLAWLHLRAGRLAAAEAYARRCEQVAANAHYSFGQSLAAGALGRIRMLQGRLDDARRHFLLELRLSEENQATTRMVAALSSLAELELQRNQLEAALGYATRGLRLSQQGDLRQWVPEIEPILATIYRRQGAYAQALEHYERGIAARDSLRSEEAQRAALTQRLGYEYELKEAGLRARQEKQRAVAQAEIRRQKLLRYATTGGALLLLLLALVLWQRFRFVRRANALIARERQRAEDLLLNILPAETANELKETGKAQARLQEQVTVLFADVENFTQWAERLPPDQLVDTLADYFAHFDRLTGQLGLEKIKTIGDAYMLAGGLNGKPANAPVAVVSCGLAMLRIADELRRERESRGQPAFAWRIGIHTGPVVAGVVGIKKFAYDIWGDTVNTAARMEQSSQAGQVNLSEATYDLVRDTFVCRARGHVVAKHKGELKMYFVVGSRAELEAVTDEHQTEEKH